VDYRAVGGKKIELGEELGTLPKIDLTYTH